MEIQYFAGIDIGGTKCAVLLGQRTSNPADMPIVERIAFPTPKNAPEALDAILSALDTVLTKHDAHSALLAIGISCGGPLDSKNGRILNPPNLCGWGNVEIVSLLRKQHDVPIFLENDANACALAEWRFGAGKGTNSMVFLTFGTGMGAGLILNGRLHRGANDMAGEIGHVRIESFGPVGFGKSGSFEGFCSGGGIAQLACMKAREQLQIGKSCAYCADLAALDTVDAKSVAHAAAEGDPTAREVYRICGEALGKGLSLLVDMLNPEAIVLGSIFARSRDLLWPHTEAVLHREALPAAFACCRVLPAALGEQIGDYAALCVAIDGIV